MAPKIVSSLDGSHFINCGLHDTRSGRTAQFATMIYQRALEAPDQDLLLLTPSRVDRIQLDTAITKAAAADGTTLIRTASGMRWPNGTTLRLELASTPGIIPAELLGQIPTE